MRIITDKKSLLKQKVDCQIVFVVAESLDHRWIKDKADMERNDFTGASDQVLYLPHEKRLYVGLDRSDPEELRLAAALALRTLRTTKVKSVALGICPGEDADRNLQAIIEGALLGAYADERYRSKPKPHPVRTLIVALNGYDGKPVDRARVVRTITITNEIAAAVNRVRDIVNMPPAELTPVAFAKIAKQEARMHGLKIAVHGTDFLKRKGMGAFLAVSAASPYPAQLIHLIYKPKRPKAKVALVGKGITFDTGGLSLKPGDSMTTMKSDESGAAAVLGAIMAAARLKLPVEVHGILGVTENVLGRHSYKPDDILRAMNGKTIEVKNTDAEGRLVLADCLVYAQRTVKPDRLVDVATLTGACVVGLGPFTAGIMGHNFEQAESLRTAGDRSGEYAAHLPFSRFLKPTLKSEIADLSNISSTRYGGAITAGMFLAEFIEPAYREKWTHIDIAGPAFSDRPWGVNPAGASGAGVRLLVEWLRTV